MRNQKLVDVLDDIETKSAKRTKEQACYVTTDGDCLFCVDGKKSSVTPSDKQIQTIKGKGKKLIVTHNHPYPYDSSITKEDLQVTINNDSAGIRAITKKWTYVAMRPEKGWGISWIEAGNIYDKHFKETKKQFDRDYQNDKMSARFYEDNLTHRVMEKVAKELGINYFRFENDEKQRNKSKNKTPVKKNTKRKSSSKTPFINMGNLF